MPCGIQYHSSIADLSKVRKILFPNEEIDEEDDDESWSDENSWNWGVEFNESHGSKDTKCLDWMNSCLITVSPHCEMLIIAHEDRYVVMTSKWVKKNQKEELVFHLTHPHSHFAKGFGEKITSALCLPIKSLQKSSPGMPDWICIILGFSSGYVRMYTVTGDLLLTEIFQDEPVHQLKFQSPTTNSNSKQDDFIVLYKKTLVIVEGTGLLNSLRVSRSSAAKGRSADEHPPLHYKKLCLQEQSKINDSFVLGTNSATQFDHLVTASVAGGYRARYNACPPVSTGIFSLGSQPYCAWHYAIEGSAAPLLSDVAYALASKVTSKIFSKTSKWLGWGGGGGGGEGESKMENVNSGGLSKSKENQIMEPATSVYPKYELYSDNSREALSASVSPYDRLAAVTDSLGRVVLVDLLRGTTRRMWKGYRDAQCGWVTSAEETDPFKRSTAPKSVAFLVIYIGKRGILEIWAPQQETRVAAFNCVKGAKLLDFSRSVDKDHPQCCLLCPDGTIHQIVVPFYCALKGDSSQKARDLHLIQQLRTALMKESVTPSTLAILMDIRHASVVNKGLDLVLECRHLTDPDALVQCLDRVVEQYAKADALDAESRLLLSRCQQLSRLAHFYIYLMSMIGNQPPNDDNPSGISLQDVADTLNVGVEEVMRIVQESPAGIQTVIQPHSIDIRTFIDSFESKSSGSGREAAVKWMWSVVFTMDGQSLDDLTPALEDSSISAGQLLSMLVSFWLALIPPVSPSVVLHFHQLVRILCHLAAKQSNFQTEKNPAAPDVVESGADSSNPLWENCHRLLSQSNNLELASCAALVIRSIMTECEKREKTDRISKDAANDSINEWEDVSADVFKWNALSKQLEDLARLSRLIRFVPARLRELQSQLLDYSGDGSLEELNFSLNSVLQKGRGSVTELIGRWLTQNLLEVDVLFGIGEEDFNNSNPEEIRAIQELFQDLSHHLPMSTQRDVVTLSVAIEYAAMWVQNPRHSKLLERSFKTVVPLRSNMLRHGICRLLWSVSLFPNFKELALLMDKSGRLPRTFAARKINLPSPDVAIPFLHLTMQLLDTTISSAMSVETEAPPVIRYDDIWPTCEGATPLIEVAARQRLINIDLVLLHHQLAEALHLIASLEIKGFHAFSLFDPTGKSAFFKEFHSYPPLSSRESEMSVISNRLNFLKQVISKAVGHMENNQQLGLDLINQSIKLGYEWNVDVDELRIKCVELLYANRMDHLGQEILPSINANDKLASALLAIAGSRLKHLMKPKDLSALSPITTDWLNGFNTDEMTNCEDVELEDSKKTMALLVQCLSRIPTDCNDHFIANELHLVLQSFV